MPSFEYQQYSLPENYKLLGNQCLVEEILETKTEMGILLPDTRNQYSSIFKGKVIKVSEGYINSKGQLIKSEFNQGDKILFLKNNWRKMGEYFLLPFESIIAIYVDSR